MKTRRAAIVGSTGMLGRWLVAEAGRRGFETAALARRGATHAVDIGDPGTVAAALDDVRPDVVVNAAALVAIDRCDRDPGEAYRVNARGVALLGEWCRRHDARLVQVSTDHYFTGDGAARHGESAPVTLLNEYARTKLAGEAFALTLGDRALVLRTNVIGCRDGATPTFGEWVIRALRNREPLTLFEDAFHSPIHCSHFAAAAFDLLEGDANGIVNLAGHEVVSKKRFIELVGETVGIRPDWATIGSVRSLASPRPESAGLDVTLAEGLLGRSLPDAAQAARALVRERDARAAC